MSRGEGELLTVPKPRAVSLLSVYLAVKPVGKPDAGNRLVRFDERGWETERCRMAQATAPILDSTLATLYRRWSNVLSHGSVAVADWQRISKRQSPALLPGRSSPTSEPSRGDSQELEIK